MARESEEHDPLEVPKSLRPSRRPRSSPEERIQLLQARIERLETQVRHGKAFAPAKVRAERRRLGFSAADYGRLVGVSGLTIYNWEKGRAQPRPRQLATWTKLCGISQAAAVRRLSAEPAE